MKLKNTKTAEMKLDDFHQNAYDMLENYKVKDIISQSFKRTTKVNNEIYRNYKKKILIKVIITVLFFVYVLSLISHYC